MVCGQTNFFHLMNAIISNVNNSGIDELNTIYAVVLHKGHGKSTEDAKSYRTISTCPILAKALDIYLRDLSCEEWASQQASTQFQGQKMSHELASLLLTETIMNSVHVSKRPVYALFLDARAAFDRVLRKILVRNLFASGMNDQRLIYFDRRLDCRQTFCEYDKEIMGPILDLRGLEQGGVSSSELYKLYNNEQADVAQASRLGVPLVYSKELVKPIHLQLTSSPTISCISLADDAVLVSNTPVDLSNLLQLTNQYCKKYDVELVPEKIQLVVFHKHNDKASELSKSTVSLSLNGKTLPFMSEASHLGVLRSELTTNGCSILDRISAHRKQLFSLLPAGIALHHGGNPTASLRLDNVYCLPVLLSGLASLLLTKTEVKKVSHYYKINLTRLMKLSDRTPDCAVYFLAGILPFEAHLHLRQLTLLTLFSMTCHLRGNILHHVACSSFIGNRSKNSSWFDQVRLLCSQYCLPHPLVLLDKPLPQKEFKTLCRERVFEFWQKEMAMKCSNLSSLRFLRSDFLPLSKPHPIWSSLPGNNPYEVRSARIQALLLTGKYATEHVSRFWSGNPSGYCRLPSCQNSEIIETREHFLLQCAALDNNRRRLYSLSSTLLADLPLLTPIFHSYLYCSDPDLQLQFLLDCSTLPLVISARQFFGEIIHQSLFKFTRTWCWSLHNARKRILDQ